MTGARWRTRGTAALAVGGTVALGLGVRLLAGGGPDGSGALARHSGTALYASMIYAGVFVLLPAARPWAAAVAAVVFCWSVELFQLTGVPASLSARSVLARLVLGVHFDPADLAWYVVGVVPPAAVHRAVARRAGPGG